MARKNSTSIFRRIYGCTLSELAEKFNCNTSNIFYAHKKGYLTHLELETASYKPIEKKLLQTMQNIRKRCNGIDPKSKYYKGMGIENHLTYEHLQFLWERDKANQMLEPSIDRIDSKGHYCLENCRFIELKENRARRWAS